ncbi:FAD-dependent oxidoreductase [Engelhardtia mirabilis]|uniref:UDP-galactopyranose mutase n=1 Tax=Engelhardtia mirabilis TaxID=2528011 RepID=A0A518BQ10_9BACT|nr:UDP-galactopyranose mutase precursor [Planctomycetes bacterium Pla133]QDV03388.1 UDP-galactopyranose mutase precursor [Planctomycetes bacterium Pla86]
MHVVVLGAGLAGLATAFELSKVGIKCTVVERDDFAGGMACSWEKNGFWLDHGPHRFHSRDEELIQHIYEVLDNEVVIRDRMSRIYMQGKFFDYPLKAMNVLKSLPPTLLVKAIADYMWIRLRQVFKPIPDDNFENWVLKRFGRTLYEMFFGTYTSKAWKMPCTEISADWASQRISQANLFDTIKKTLNPPREGEVRSLVSEFWYPANGGIGQIGRKYAEKIREMGNEVALETPVERIEVEDGVAKRVICRQADGSERTIECDEIVNTIPLSRLLECMRPEIGPDVVDAISKLRYIGIVFVYLEIDEPTVSPDHWVYLPEKHLTIHRISEFKNFSDASAPGDKTVVCCEITCNVGDEDWNMDLEQGAKVAIDDLVTVGLLKPGTARGIDLHKLPYAYPVYDLTYKENLDTLKKAVKQVKNIRTTGRQGLYRYNNMDHSIAMGRRTAKTVAKGVDARADEVAAGQEYFG